MLSERQILDFVDKLEDECRKRDASVKCRIQVAQGLQGPVYLVFIDSAIGTDQYNIDTVTGTFVRVINV